MAVHVRSVSYRYPRNPAPALIDINLDVPDGESVAILGPSGSGKSTLLKIIASFFDATSGSIEVDGDRVSRRMVGKSLAYVSQDAFSTLFPWMTVYANLLAPSRLRGTVGTEVLQRCDWLLEQFKLAKHRTRYPYQLSGGEQKRLSLAIALSYSPRTLILDEPFSGVDTELTLELWSHLLSFQKDSHASVVLVTHSLDEAIMLCNRVLYIGPGKSLHHLTHAVDPEHSKQSHSPIHNYLASAEAIMCKEQLLAAIEQTKTATVT